MNKTLFFRPRCADSSVPLKETISPHVNFEILKFCFLPKRKKKLLVIDGFDDFGLKIPLI